MTTNIFSCLEGLEFYGNITLQMALSNEKIWTGYVHFSDPTAPDQVNGRLVPLTFTGTSAKLDSAFLSGIVQPVREVKEMFTNQSAFDEGVKAAAKAGTSSAGKSNASSTTVLPARYLEMMKKVDHLVFRQKFGEAIGAMPSKEKFPEQAALIDKRMNELKSLHGGFRLFPEETHTSTGSSSGTTTGNELEDGPSSEGEEDKLDPPDADTDPGDLVEDPDAEPDDEE